MNTKSEHYFAVQFLNLEYCAAFLILHKDITNSSTSQYDSKKACV